MLKIGNTQLASNLLLSPIAGYCDLAFRLTIRPLGGLGLASTDLVNPRGLLRRTARSMEIVETAPEDQPLCIQLYGNEPDEMADAARCGHDRGAAVIDINMGCPVDKVCKRSGGATLLRQPAEAIHLAERVVKAVEVPVTVKMRLGWDEHSIVAPRLAAGLQDVGVAAITVHGRTAAQKFRDTVDLAAIARVVEAASAIPVIGNGDVRSPEDARMMIRETGCAGVMIGRWALTEPWIFRDTHALLTTGVVPPPPTRRERIAFMNHHFEHLLRISGEHRACVIFRQRVSWYLRRLGGCPEFRDRIRFLSSAAEYRELVELLADADENAASAHTRPRPAVSPR